LVFEGLDETAAEEEEANGRKQLVRVVKAANYRRANEIKALAGFCCNEKGVFKTQLDCAWFTIRLVT